MSVALHISKYFTYGSTFIPHIQYHKKYMSEMPYHVQEIMFEMENSVKGNWTKNEVLAYALNLWSLLDLSLWLASEKGVSRTPKWQNILSHNSIGFVLWERHSKIQICLIQRLQSPALFYGKMPFHSVRLTLVYICLIHRPQSPALFYGKMPFHSVRLTLGIIL